MKRVMISMVCLISFGFADGDYIQPVDNKLYKQECGSCHFAYQPGFLPKRSWIRMMKTKELENHFGTDATLEEEDSRSLMEYLAKNAADMNRGNKISRKFDRSIPKESTPLAISKVRYFVKEHREIPKRLITQEEVKSISNCAACHTKADRGDYNERTLIIPNYGRWDD
ncbi:MAG: diheme cytochrome c [Sulfurovum sp.]|nr:diheme cytochrome c [Sulfurovum sp.]